MSDDAEPRVWRRARKYALLLLATIAIVVVPFLLWGETFERLTAAAMDASRPAAATAGFLLLAADVALPVPSTVVISLMGGLLGEFWATAIAAAGLSLGCIIGYWLGRRVGRDFAERAMGRDDLFYLADKLERHGAVVLALCRPVPVLAEASVIAAGVTGMGAAKVLTVTALANVGFAAVYAALGAAADTGAGLLAAVAASLALPLLAALLARRARVVRAPD